MVDIQPLFDSSELDVSVNLDQHSVSLKHCEPHSKMEASTVKDTVLTSGITDTVNQDVLTNKILSRNEVDDVSLFIADDSGDLPTLDEANNDDDLLEMDDGQQEQETALSNTHQPQISSGIDAEIAGILDNPLLLSSSRPASPSPVVDAIDTTITDLQDDNEHQLLLDINTTKEMADVESADGKVLSSSLSYVSQLMVAEEEEEEEEAEAEEEEERKEQHLVDTSTTADYQVDKEMLDQVPCIYLQHQGVWYSMFRADPSQPEQEVFFNQNDELALYYCDLSQFTQTLKESYMLEDREVTLEFPYLELLLTESSSYMHDYTLRDIYQMYKALWLTLNEADSTVESFEPLRILLMDRPNSQEQLARLQQLVANGQTLTLPAVANTDNNDQSNFDDVASSIIDTWEEEVANITGNSSVAHSPTPTTIPSNDNNEAYTDTTLDQHSQHDDDDDDDDDLLAGLDDNPASTTAVGEQNGCTLEDNTIEDVADANLATVTQEAEQLLERELEATEDDNNNHINNSDNTLLLGSKRQSGDFPDETDNKRMRQV